MRARKTSAHYIKISAALVAGVVLPAAFIMAANATQSGSGFGAIAVLPSVEQLFHLPSLAGQAAQSIVDWLADHYQRVPTLLLGLAALILVPVISLVCALVRSFANGAQDPQWFKVHGEDHTARHRLDTHQLGVPNAAKPVPDRTACEAGRPVWPSKATVELRDATGNRKSVRIPLSQPVVQIGRSDDADIVIHDPTVHRHHATIHYTEDAQYMVTDMSAGTGNGVVVNGHPVFQHQIFDGDEIRLGTARLMFHTAQT